MTPASRCKNEARGLAFASPTLLRLKGFPPSPKGTRRNTAMSPCGSTACGSVFHPTGSGRVGWRTTKNRGEFNLAANAEPLFVIGSNES